MVAPPPRLDPHIQTLNPLTVQDLLVIDTDLCKAHTVRFVIELLISELERLDAVTEGLDLLAAGAVVVPIAVHNKFFELEVVNVLEVDPCRRHVLRGDVFLRVAKRTLRHLPKKDFIFVKKMILISLKVNFHGQDSCKILVVSSSAPISYYSKIDMVKRKCMSYLTISGSMSKR